MLVEARAELKAQIEAEGEHDHIGLWEIVRCVRGQLPWEDSQTVKDTTLEIVEDLLSTGRWQAGFPAADGRGFSAWNVALQEAIDRISREWTALGREPNIGEIAWFNLSCWNSD
ncbi:MAG: hypothetical protein KY476_18995 [Planctomycetes bacterium]|nr:hypothetical protein [Planctomycetota bacterium]